MIKVTQHTENFVSAAELSAETEKAKSLLPKISASSMAGWLDLPKNYDREEFARIKSATTKIRFDSKYLVCIGIGGSYLGARAIIEALGNTSDTKILYAGNSLSSIELSKTLETLGDADFSVNIISKSGTTLEPAIAFRIFKQKLIDKYGEAEAFARIYATTDANKGALHDEAVVNGYQTFVVPDNIGGRYSVLTAVGLLPIAVAGINIDEFMAGALDEHDAGSEAAMAYATARNILLTKGYDIEVLASFEPTLTYLNEWWKQLFGESEGKEGKGIFPASVIYTTDLHSLGQYLQEGRRNLLETFINISTPPAVDHVVPSLAENADGLAYVEGKTLSYVNEKACAATIEAHLAGGVPILAIDVLNLSARSLGALVYFFEYACAISATILSVDPFDQPGVEAYKNNMFRLLGKPA